MRIQILPSLLAADMGSLEAAARRAEASGADALHIDIMDGHFVPNLSMGPAVVAMARRCVKIPLSVHLMLTRPDRYVDSFADAGASSLQIHVESECLLEEALAHIRSRSVKVGLTLNPETDAEAVGPYIGLVDEVLCMTVRPGYGGQAFMPEVLPKIRAVRRMAAESGKGDIDVMVDGGVTRETGSACAAAGANALVAGTFLFKAPDMAAETAGLRDAAAAAWAD
jgi:ribulose-phosphate 3-epimerase